MPLRTTSRRLGLLAVLLSFVVTLGGLTAGAYAAVASADSPAATSETVAGKVTNSSNVGITGVTVTVYRPVGTGTSRTFQPAASGTTASDGSYSVVVPGAGTYRLGFSQASLEPRFYPAALTVGEAGDVAVAAGQAVTGRNVKMLQPAVISGRITLADKTAYTGGGTLSLLRQASFDPVSGVAGTNWTTSGSGTIDPGGTVVVTAPGATYRLRLSLPSYGAGYLPGMVGLDKATNLTLTSGKTTSGLSYALPGVSNVSGRVLDPAAGPVSGSTVKLQYSFVDQILAGQAVTQWVDYPGAATSAADGRWALDALHRTYRVRATGTLNGTSYSVYYPEAPSVQTGNDVVVKAPVTGVDLTVGNPPLTAVTNTSVPWVGGAAKAGSTLTANVGTWKPGNGVTFTYQWLDHGTPIDGATGATFAIGALSSGGTYSVRVTGTAAGLGTATLTSMATGPAAGLLGSAAFENRALPVITGKAETGGTLSASSGQWSTTPSAFAYQWSADGVDIVGATAATFLPKPAQLGKAIRVKVTATSGSAKASGTSAPTAAVVTGPLRNVTLPAITGTPKVGNVLTATPGTWSGESPSFAYQWLADGTPVAGATAATLTPTAAMVGKKLSVRVTASLTGYSPGQAESARTAAVESQGTVVPTVAPSITGAARVGQTLTADPGSWTPTPTSYEFAWQAGGVAIAGATAPTYVLTSAEVGKTVTVRVTAKHDGFLDGVATSPATAPVTAEAISVTNGPTLSGKARVGQVLQARPGSVSPSGVTVTYQWLRSGTAIPGATGPMYAVTKSDLGRKLSVRATYSDGDATPVVRTSRTTGKVRSTPQFSVQRSADGRSVSLNIGVKAPGVSSVSGIIRVFEHGQKLARRALTNGRVIINLDGLSRGQHTFTIRFSGGGDVANGSTIASIRVG